MTRESKLALIVGFGLVLFVGILVSDHFSAGQRQEAAHLLAQRGALRGASAPISIQPLSPLPTPPVQQVAQARGPEVPGAPGGDGSAAGPAPGSGSLPRVDPPVPPAPPASAPGEIVLGGPGSRQVPGITIGPESPKVEPAATARLYPVKEGETLYSICSAEYGDGSLWKALADFNKSAIPNPARLRKGVTLRLPPIEVLKPGAVAKAAPGGATPAAPGGSGGAAPSAPGSAPGAAVASTYTVQEGETLSDIARKKLGSTKRWKDVAKLNEDVIRDPHALRPGTVIRLPSQG